MAAAVAGVHNTGAAGSVFFFLFTVCAFIFGRVVRMNIQ